MNGRQFGIAACFVLILIVGCLGCGGAGAGTTGATGLTPPTLPPGFGPLPPPQAILTLGPDQQIAAFTLGSGDSTHTVTGTHTPLDGLTIENTPDGSAPSRTVTLHYRRIAASSFVGVTEAVASAMPVLISIDAPGASKFTPMIVTAKLTPPSGQMESSQFLNGVNNTMIPIVHSGVSSGTSRSVLIPRFGVFSPSQGADSSGFFFSTMPSPSSALAPSSRLRASTALQPYDTGYRVGMDNCPFPNMGSDISPDGECAGTVYLNSWYFVSQKPSTGHLSPYLDDNSFAGSLPTPMFWQDDSKGYRLASSLQSTAANPSISQQIYEWLFPKKLPPAQATYEDVLTALSNTKRPQILQLFGIENGQLLSHKVVAYGAQNNYIFVDDPNYPYSSAPLYRTIYANTDGSFNLYSSGSTTDGTLFAYTEIYLLPSDYWLSDSQVASAWAGLSTAGNGVFPTYTLPATDASGSIISQDAQGTLSTPGTSIALKPTGSKTLTLKAFTSFTASSEPLTITPVDGSYSIQLQTGSNKLGIEIDDANGYYVDFRYLTINAGATSTFSANMTITGGVLMNATVAGATQDVQVRDGSGNITTLPSVLCADSLPGGGVTPVTVLRAGSSLFAGSYASTTASYARSGGGTTSVPLTSQWLLAQDTLVPSIANTGLLLPVTQAGGCSFANGVLVCFPASFSIVQNDTLTLTGSINASADTATDTITFTGSGTPQGAADMNFSGGAGGLNISAVIGPSPSNGNGTYFPPTTGPFTVANVNYYYSD